MAEVSAFVYDKVKILSGKNKLVHEYTTYLGF